jgi:hydroxymethylpyrimidine pyrophosphatase-like HAD family hydrolase
MRFVALAADFDGTLASDGVIDPATISALERLRHSGRELILVTGREVPELVAACPELGLFSLVVAENGAVLYWPATERFRLLADPPPLALVDALCALNVAPLSVGNVIVATWHPHEATVLATIRHLGLEHQVIFNKGAVMVLPPGINKASGLTAALHELGLSPHNVVGIGDAENDHSFLSLCECAVAVDNALPTLKQRADFVTSLGHGAGVVELIDELLATDLREREPLLQRHNIPLGTRANGEPMTLPSHDVVILIAGPPVSGKSTLALGLMERLTERGHQICVVDPEGDYEAFGEVKVEVRRVRQATARVAELLELPTRNVCVDLLGLSMTDRPRFGADLLSGIKALQQRTARPHWLVLDEAHHLFPFKSSAPPERPPGLVLVTVDIDGVSQAILSGVDVVIATGAGADVTVRAFYQAIGEPVPTIPPTNLNWGEALVSLRDASDPPFLVSALPTRTKHRRHRRKYDIGDVGAGRGFYFRGPWNGGDHYAPNLSRFVELAVQVGDEVWFYHLHRGDYERWFRDVIKDDDLAIETAQIVALVSAGSPVDSRQRVRTAIIDRYAGPG